MGRLFFIGFLSVLFFGVIWAENCETCTKADLTVPFWCKSCQKGVAFGATTNCETCFQGMTHSQGGWCESCQVGHSLGRKTACKECFSAMLLPEGGWCKTCDRGYAYRLETSCKSCFQAMTTDISLEGNEMKGWCKKCKLGYVQGIKVHCANCYCLILSDGWCKVCKVGYVQQKKTSCEHCFQILTSAGKTGNCMTCMKSYTADGQVLPITKCGVMDKNSECKDKDQQ